MGIYSNILNDMLNAFKLPNTVDEMKEYIKKNDTDLYKFILLSGEIGGLTNLLIEKGLITKEEYNKHKETFTEILFNSVAESQLEELKKDDNDNEQK